MTFTFTVRRALTLCAPLLLSLAMTPSAQSQDSGVPLMGLLSAGSGGGELISQLAATGVFPRGITILPILPDAGALLLSNNEGPGSVLLGLGGPLKGQLVPAFDILVNDPAATLDYFLGGGTVLSPELVIVPGIPLISSPIGL